MSTEITNDYTPDFEMLKEMIETKHLMQLKNHISEMNEYDVASFIEELVSIETKHNISCMSWYSQILWDEIKILYKKNPSKIEQYRQVLKINMAS